MAGPFVKSNIAALEGTAKVSTESCASLVQWYTSCGRAATWTEGTVVKGNGATIAAGTAIATFVNGSYPNQSSGNHAAFYMSQDSTGITVMDQWSGPTKPTVSSRKLAFKGKNSNGTFKDPSNNGDAFSVIMT